MVMKTDNTALFTPLNPWCTEEEYCDDLTMPRKVQHNNRLEALSKRCLFDPSWEGTRERKCFGKPNRMQSSHTARCHVTVLNV